MIFDLDLSSWFNCLVEHVRKILGDIEMPLFDPDQQKVLNRCVSEIPFMSRGIFARIAKEVGVSREFVRKVITSDDSFNKYRSDNACKVWNELRTACNDNRHSIDTNRLIYEALACGHPINYKGNCTRYRFVTTMLKNMKVPHESKLLKVSSTGNFYEFKPIR